MGMLKNRNENFIPLKLLWNPEGYQYHSFKRAALEEN
jgi:hypothetical protein